MATSFPIGIFDSGYGGLTVMQEIVKKLPGYDFIYLGDNARTPYGNRSFETVYQYTLQSIEWLFRQNCPLVIVACNTASAKALRTIQQNDLPGKYPGKKVLGVIRPTTEVLGSFSETGHVGIVATAGTVSSDSYAIELHRFSPQLTVYQKACPMWVPLVENNEQETKGADFFVKRDLHLLFEEGENIDVLLLACTHFPLLLPLIEEHVPVGVKILSQGTLVAESLADYLFRHPETDVLCSKNGARLFYTTDDPVAFNNRGSRFYGEEVKAEKIDL